MGAVAQRVVAPAGVEAPAGYTGIHTSAELYDPATGLWSEAGHMSVDRYYHTSTPLADGRVLTAGGASNGNQASAELYAEGR